MVFGLVMVGTITLSTAFVSNISLLGFLWILNNWFQSMGWPPATRMLTHWYASKELGIKWSLCATSNQLGGAMTMVICGYLVDAYGWEAAFMVPGIIALVISALLYNRLRNSPQEIGLPIVEEYKECKSPTGDAYKRLSIYDLAKLIIYNRLMWYICFANMFVYIVRLGIIFWAPLFLYQLKNISISEAGWHLASYEVVGLVGGIGAGWMSDKIFQGRRGPVGTVFMLALSIIIILFWQLPKEYEMLSLFIITLAGIFVSGPQVLIGIATADFTTKQAVGTANGLSGLFGYLGSAIAAHRIIGHQSKCQFLHGHRYVLEVTVSADITDSLGMVMDFGQMKLVIKKWIDSHFDHNLILHQQDKEMGDKIASWTGQKIYYMQQNPTAENLALHLKKEILPTLFSNLFNNSHFTITKVKLFETPNCFVEVVNQIVAKLLETELAACIQVDNVTSYFKWQGKFSSELEYRVVIKASSANYLKIEKVLIDAVTGEYSKQNIHAILITANNNPHLVDKLKLGIYLNNSKFFKEATSTGDINSQQEIIQYLAYYFASTKIDQNWLNQLLPEIQCWIVAAKIYCMLRPKFVDQGQEVLTIKQLITHNLSTWVISSDFIIDLFLDFFFLNGDLENINHLVQLTQTNSIKYPAILGVSYFLQGETAEALVKFDISMKNLKDVSKKRNICLSGIYGICHILSLLQADHSNNLVLIQNLLKNYQALKIAYDRDMDRLRYSFSEERLRTMEYFIPAHEMSYSLLTVLTEFLTLNSQQLDQALSTILKYVNKKLNNALDDLILFLVLCWTKSKIIALNRYSLELRKMYDPILLGLVSVVKQGILPNGKDTNSQGSYAPYNFDFLQIIQVKPEWERAFNSLSNYFNKRGNIKSYDKRLVWFLSPNNTRDMIVPIEQKRIGNSNWNKGRAISLKRLFENHHSLDFVSNNDKPIIASIQRDHSYYGSYFIDNDKALLALVNHPLIFDADTGEHIELTKASLELIIKEDKNHYQIKLSAYSEIPIVELQKEGTNKYQVLEISQGDLDLAKIVGNQGITVPKTAQEKVLSLLQNATSNMNVRTELETMGLDSTPADSSLVVQLTMIDEILKIKVLVRPFGSKGSYYKPGHGNTNIVAQIDNIYKSVIRDLATEQENVLKLLDQCPTLSQQDNTDYEWKVDELESGLEILYELNDYKNKNSITIEWPYGQSLFVDREISFDNLKLNITSNNQWFNFDGEVAIDENQVMEMQTLLTKLNQSKGRFIELSDKRFIALTESFAKRLKELNIAAKADDKGQAIHKLGVPLLLEFAQKSNNVQADKKWKAHIDKISKAEKYDPKVPNNLQAELRAYQIEGFKWLAKLTNLGFGACLADDMGLGKTIQTITLLLDQATIGPCLVVAPASVCYVWEEECKKFAPSLNCISLNSINNREERVNNLGKMDVLICSYGILYQIGELLATKQFQIVVLDEAQAIKNFNTKRFKIITQFKTINRIALSGTPVENRTEELWNLFEFLNPGFLGSRQLFQAKYTKPIEIDRNIIARNTLKRLIQPFILRRIKSKVLDELPPKIEQTIFIEPTQQEKDFYEALRRESVERINNLTDASEAQKRFSILAEITKLRRACCDSSLVDTELELANSKLEAFDKIVSELKENNHRALVFSQYVGYLEIVKKRLDAQKISYHYLDGSSTQKQRQENVESFQSGKGDLFLISLKAGGVGLNLTAADYVIHLDPWWNPAVEDQASDRAHRIGQTRPVTIYRLVMKHSIEEKILKMHHEKRELAIGLLSDSDKNASLNQSDLLALINQTTFG
ncbi:putative ATP-dependent helicase YwqA [Pseudolycoriella hygida]|uniref:ATP-dependent helicase YwqA n=1 Tax=Pseudolycoriella hygida TaxID=35572 RepID=A0A9Q0N8V2_9DIPT|nr:putative ATP-dependent helicase YwqA [Pseudolycoriella hygida]